MKAYPLTWPGRPRTPVPERAKFARKVDRHREWIDSTGAKRTSTWKQNAERTIAAAERDLYAELERLGAEDVIVSTNMRLKLDGTIRANATEPQGKEAAAAVYFTLNGAARVLACDRWDRLADNLWAIKLHIESIRGQERWGVGSVEQAFAGYAALPESAGGRPWYEALGVQPDASLELCVAAFKQRARKVHPDMGGTREEWDELQQAFEQAKAATKR